MSKKKRALKALVWLGVIVSACMYFSRTIQTITTPKVKLVQATTGRIEQKISVEAKPYFPVETEITLNKAKDYPITVDKVYVKPGLLVKEGDTIFTATINDYQTKEEDLLTKYNEKSQELIDLDIKNRKNSKQSMQNDLYDLMIEKQDALNEAESKARLAAAAEGIDLTFDQTLWEAKAKQAGASSDTMALIRAAAAAERPSRPRATISTPATKTRKSRSATRCSSTSTTRNKLLEEMQDLSDQMVKLMEAKQALGTVTATSEGYIVALDLKAGDSYDGQKSAYTIAKKEDVPVLRADVTDLKKDVSEGARVEMAGDYDTFRAKSPPWWMTPTGANTRKSSLRRISCVRAAACKSSCRMGACK